MTKKELSQKLYCLEENLHTVLVDRFEGRAIPEVRWLLSDLEWTDEEINTLECELVIARKNIEDMANREEKGALPPAFDWDECKIIYAALNGFEAIADATDRIDFSLYNEITKLKMKVSKYIDFLAQLDSEHESTDKKE